MKYSKFQSSLVLSAILLSATLAPNPAIGQNDYSEDAERMRSQIEALESDSFEVRTERDRLLKEVAAVDQDVAEIENNRTNALDNLKKEDLSQQDTRRAKYLQLLEFEQRTVALNSTMPTLLEVANQDNLAYAIRDNDVNRLARTRAYLNYLALSQSIQIEALYNSLRNSSTGDDNADIASLVLYTDDLKQQLADKRKAKVTIERQVDALNRQLVTNQTEIRELREALNHLIAQQAAMDRKSEETATTSQKFKFSAPIEAPVKRKFGDPKKAYGNQWTGLLYAAEAGQIVRAAASGVVIFAKEHKTLGRLIIIDHGDELFTLYAHNHELTVRLGDIVVAQQLIAKAGETGEVTSPALYFEIRDNGEPVDPLPRLGG